MCCVLPLNELASGMSAVHDRVETHRWLNGSPISFRLPRVSLDRLGSVDSLVSSEPLAPTFLFSLLGANADASPSVKVKRR